MEQERAIPGVRFLSYGCTSGFSPIFITAAVSIAALLAVVGWEALGPAPAEPLAPAQDTAPYDPLATTVPMPASYALHAASTEAPASTSSADAIDPSDTLTQLGATVLSNVVGAYANLQNAGTYSTSSGEAAARDVLPGIQATPTYTTYAPSDIARDQDTSYQRMLTYRADLRVSLAPLLKNTTPEYEIFGDYVQTGDRSYLAELEQVAQEYRDAADATARVVAPADAVSYHVAILNAMQEFAAVLDSLATHADDPFAVAALLRSYDQAESDMLTSFNALTTYYKSKHQ